MENEKCALILLGSPFLTGEPLNNHFHLIKTLFDTNTDMDTGKWMLLECCINYLCSIYNWMLLIRPLMNFSLCLYKVVFLY